MKKIFIILAAFLILIAIGIGVLILTFDPAQYAPMIKNKLETSLDSEIQFDDIHLSWQGGVGLEVKNLLITDRALGDQNLPIEIKKLRFNLHLAPLLRKSVQIGSVEVVQPSIHMTKTPGGRVYIGGLKSLFDPHKKSKPGASPALSFLIEMLKIKDAEFYYHDASIEPPVHLHIQKINSQIRNFSLLHPLRLEIQGGIFGENNFKLSGQVRLVQAGGSVELKDFQFLMDLGKIELPALKIALPALASAPLEKMSGNLFLSVPQLNPAQPETLQVTARLEKGVLTLLELPEPITNLEAEADFTGGHLTVSNLSSNLGQAKFQAKGDIKNFSTQPVANFNLNLSQLSSEELSARDPAAPHLKGMAGLSFQGGSTAPNLGQFADFLFGEGRLSLEDGVLMNVNVMQSIFQKISIIPGLIDKLQQKLPPDYRERLNQPNTYLSNIDQAFEVQNRMLYANQIRIETEEFRIGGAFQYQFDHLLRAQTVLEIVPELSQALTSSVKELSYLANEQGSIQIPVNISGRLPKVQIFPDLQYIGSRLAMVTAQEFLGNWMQKKGLPTAAGETGGPEDPTAPRETQKPSSPWDLLGGFLPQNQAPSGTPVPPSDPSSGPSPNPSAQSPRSGSLFDILNTVIQPKESTGTSDSALNTQSS